jgi:hypothetical protein
MPPCADGVQPIAEKPTPTPKRKNLVRTQKFSEKAKAPPTLIEN